MLNRLWLLLLIFAGFTRAHADVALLLEEPYGVFGSVNPTGHAAIYLPQICAASPIQLRRCEPGEGGAVISRYYKIGGYGNAFDLMKDYSSSGKLYDVIVLGSASLCQAPL